MHGGHFLTLTRPILQFYLSRRSPSRRAFCLSSRLLISSEEVIGSLCSSNDAAPSCGGAPIAGHCFHDPRGPDISTNSRCGRQSRDSLRLAQCCCRRRTPLLPAPGRLSCDSNSCSLEDSIHDFANFITRLLRRRASRVFGPGSPVFGLSPAPCAMGAGRVFAATGFPRCRGGGLFGGGAPTPRMGRLCLGCVVGGWDAHSHRRASSDVRHSSDPRP